MNIFFYCVISCLLSLPLQAIENDFKKSIAEGQASQVDLKRSGEAVSKDAPLPEYWHHILSFLSYGMEPQEAREWMKFGHVSKRFRAVSEEWLQKHLRTSREYLLFQRVMIIHKIATDVADEALAAREVSTVELSSKLWPGCSHAISQAKRGLLLSVGFCPEYLDTPWGRVMLYAKITGTNSGKKSLSARFLSRLSTTFFNIPVALTSGLHYYQVDMQRYLEPGYQMYQNADRIKDLTSEHIRSLEGIPVFVYHNADGFYPILAIHKIGDEEVEAPRPYRPYENRHSPAYLKKQWSMLAKMYEKEALEASGSKK